MTLFRKFHYGDYDAMNAGAPTPSKGETSPNPSKEGLSTLQPSLSEESANNIESSQGRIGAAANPPLGGGGAWPLWEIFIRSKQGLDHKHVGSLHAVDAQMAVENARDVYTRRQEGVSIWVVESRNIHASNPDEAESFYEPAADKVYRHPTFYDLPDEVNHM